MNRTRWWLLPLLFLGLCSALLAQSLQPVPKFSARALDLTGTLTVPQLAALEQKLAAFQQRKGSQVAVLIVPSTEPETVDQYAIRVFEQWKPGRGKVDGKWVDDGAILLIAKNDRKMRLEVGYGLEGALPDATAKRIIDETVAPLFRQGDFYGGIDAGVDRAIRVIDGEALPAPKQDQTWKQGTRQIGNFLPLLIFLVFGVSAALRQMLGRGGGALATGGVTGGAAYLFTQALSVASFAGILAFLFALLAGGAGGGWTNSRRGYRGGGWGGGLGGGGFGGGGFGGGGGGGFGGGGGGRSGGGGASGGW